MERKAKVPIDINGEEYRRLKENLESFNETSGEKLTFDEFVSLSFETSSLEEKLDFKYDYLNALEAEIEELEKELESRCSIGLTGSEENYAELMEFRRKILKDSSNCINGTY
jgi:CII-binding regulator of phage lambda lysogenization HflD